MTKDELTKLLDTHQIQIRRKVVAKEITPEMSHILVQSLEGTPRLDNLKGKQIKIFFYKYDEADQAVKNQMLEDPDAYFVASHYEDIDSTQLRSFFKD